MNLRAANPEDRGAIIRVLRAAFGHWHNEASEAYWDWKFERNPHGCARIWVGEDDGTIAGCYVWNPVQLAAGNTTLRGAQSVDAAVHPDYQGRGLFTKLARTATEDPECDFAVVYAFPTVGAYHGQLKVGFRDLFPIAKTIRPLLLAPIRRPRTKGLAIQTVENFDARFDIFASNRTRAELAVVRDAAYLQWRYVEDPARAHETIACERDGELRAYCVLALDRTRSRSVPGYIIDLQALPDASDDARELVLEALGRLRRLGSRVAVAWAQPDGPEQRALAAAGFSGAYTTAWQKLRRPQFTDRFILLERREPSAGVPPGRWSLVPGDTDYM